MRVAEQWRKIEEALPEGWSDARLELTVEDSQRSEEAGRLLAPLQPGRRGERFRFEAVRRGAGPSPGAVGRALDRLDNEGVRGRLALLESAEAATTVPTSSPTLVGAWDAELDELPSDWSDLYAEIDVASTDHLDRAALLLAPVNPARYGEKPGFRFRSARRFGYGASPSMVRRCLERLDSEPIRGDVRILRALSDTRHVATQGPVWYVGGRAV